MPALNLLDVPEFAPAIEHARTLPGARLTPVGDYLRLESDRPLELQRAAVGLAPAVWFGLVVGGIEGEVAVFDDQRLVLR